MVADDLVQETLILALQRVGQLREQARLNAWMYTILSNCWRQHLRRARDHVEFEDAIAAGDDNPEHNTRDLEIVGQVTGQTGYPEVTARPAPDRYAGRSGWFLLCGGRGDPGDSDWNSHEPVAQVP